MRVFISHSSKDKPAVEALATALHARRIEPWFDKWEIGPGDDIVASINAGLEAAEAGIIVFSRHSKDRRWLDAEISFLTYECIEARKLVIPVIIGEDYWIPPLLRSRARRGIEEIDALVEALHGRKPKPPPVIPPERGHVERVVITLRRNVDAGVSARLLIGTKVHGEAALPALPNDLAAAQAAFLRGFRYGMRRDIGAAERREQEAHMAQLGRILGDFCLPGGSGTALAGLIDGPLVGTTVEICWESDDPDLLGLPFEAACLPDGRVLALQSSVVMMRRPLGVAAPSGAALAGPLKILVAVAAPDEGLSTGVVLDQERELQNILDAVEPAQRLANCEVRILEVGHPNVIGGAIEADAYHVLHLSCHGLPGALELEDEEGRAVRTSAAELLAPIQRTGRPLPLVLLNSCSGGVAAAQTASLAEALLRGGIPAVVAMQAPVSDAYAIGLAKSFYTHLARRENFLASRALADARKEEERQRLDAIRRGAPAAQTQPEYATAALYVAGEERPIADFALDHQPLQSRPVHDVPGPVPQLRLDDLIGRRRELREALRSLRDPARKHAGVVLTGIGGVGKSALAGRAMCRLAEAGWLVAAPDPGRFDLRAIAIALGAVLLESRSESVRKRGEDLVRADLDDSLRLHRTTKTLAEDRVLLVLDDFEQNLTMGGDAFRDPDAADLLGRLARGARAGRLLITCRYPLPGSEAWLCRIPVGPLSPAEARKLRLRLPALAASNIGDAVLLRLIGGHPRMLELLDALLRGGTGRLPAVTEKLRRLAEDQKIDLPTATMDIASGIETALVIGARDVLLGELMTLVRSAGIEEVLLQVAVSNLPVTPQGLARMMAEHGTADASAVEFAAAKLEALSLMHGFPDGALMVHRWTAQGLAGLSDPASHHARSIRAGKYRMWRLQHETHAFEDAIEAIRNFLAGQDFDAAVDLATAAFDALRRMQQSLAIAALASEVLETLPESHGGYAGVADEEAQAHLALGQTTRAVARYQKILGLQENLSRAEPERADHQRDLSVSYERMGDLYRALGQGDDARKAFLKALAIRERLAQDEPDRADYQRDLSVSYNKMGDLYRALGQGDDARKAFLKALAIRERLAQDEPERADYQRDLVVSYVNVSENLPGEARAHLSRALEIARSLHSRGRLAPADAWMLDELARRLGDAADPGASPK